MSEVRVACDADLEPTGELPLATLKPYGHVVMHLVDRDFALISRDRKCLGRFEEPGLAQPFMRILMLDAERGKGRLDFALWRWNASAPGWEIYQRTIALRETLVDSAERRAAA